jgi:plasmid stabilization system protein ParE
MILVFRPEALSELLEAQAWYELRSPGLGYEFARSVDAGASRMLRTPLTYARIDGDFRQLILRRFPYSLIYRPTDTEVVVVSCFHHRRKPDAWRKNIVD